MIQSHFNDFLDGMKSKKEPGILTGDDKEKDKLNIEGIDEFGNSYDIFKSIKTKKRVDGNNEIIYEVNLTFYGNHNEDNLRITLPQKLILESDYSIRVNMKCNPENSGKWESVTAYRNQPVLNDNTETQSGEDGNEPLEQVDESAMKVGKGDQMENLGDLQFSSILTANKRMPQPKQKKEEVVDEEKKVT